MPKPAHGYDKPLTEKGELSERGRTKLQAQVKKAESIMRTEGGTYGREKTKAYYQAKRMRDRAQKLLGKKVSPGGKPPQKAGDKYEKRRKPFEKLLPGDSAPKLREVEKKTRAKAALVGVAKRAQEANER